MKLAAVSFLAALVAAPLAAQAAQAPVRYSVTLEATIRDEITYVQDTVVEDCVIKKIGSGGRELDVRSVRPAPVRGLRGSLRVLVRGATLVGSFVETRRCRFLPPERSKGRCDSLRLAPVRVQAVFRRSGRNRIAFERPSTRAVTAKLCGLSGEVPVSGWLNLAQGAVDERAFRSGRPKVVAKGSVNREATGTMPGDPTVKLTEHVVIRWTLTFRRASVPASE